MTDLTFGQESTGAAVRSASDLYRAVWRWHFYAGLLVLPFMITLAITGALYLFRDEIDAVVHANLKQVEIRESVANATPSAMVAAALIAHPGTAVKFTDPASPSASAEITVSTEAAGKLAVYVDPYSGKVLGSLPDRGTIMWTIRYLHSLKYFGWFTRALIEIAGGWSILLVGTGIYLWWPRRQTGGVLSIRGTPKRRVFWRDIHAVTGAFAGFFIVFLAITGMPWSGVWGAKVNEWANGNNFGYPAGVRTAVPMSDEHLDHVAKTSWSLEQAQVPQSPGHQHGTAPIGLDEAVAAFDRLGLHRGYAVNIPTTPTGVYTGSVYPDDLSQQRVVHLDQYSGKPLLDMSYSDYGPLGKWLEWGINVHMGQEFGLVNQIVLLAACIAIVALAVSAGVMWWKRRPAGSLGVPPLPSDRRVFRALVAILVAGGILFPLVGLSLVIMLGLDWGYFKLARQRST
ncbi:PepSY-associated TM helix domain-containing protein [Sinorhizobium medicae]|uniref:PepSY-associated TM helix domain-containing protein n=1 Tax=Sinorhizobium medicae TaxID=110321 RepID=UPI002B1BDD45|nr:PepSY domain-containing protein [Sinorhizobium medicae]WQO48527.1 PepSY domain-containing protein [Sinorhizobium medicae]